MKSNRNSNMEWNVSRDEMAVFSMRFNVRDLVKRDRVSKENEKKNFSPTPL